MPNLSETFIFAIANSLHCAGMCGPLAMCFQGGKLATGAYHVGRVSTYTAFGAVSGWIGATLEDQLALPDDWLPSAWISIGLGAFLLATTLGLRRGGFSPPTPKIVTRLFQKTRGLPPTWAALCIGMATPLLPCGILYLALGMALIAGSTWLGAATMMTFALGSLPLLLLAQLQIRWFAQRMQPQARALLFRWMLRGAALLLIGRGLLALQGGSCCGG